MKVLLDECLPKKLKHKVEAELSKLFQKLAGRVKRTVSFCDLRSKISMYF